ncbi:MAG: ORF6N domain-containing protein [Candidatus Omnitrophica bacterium]|nr:ORF6N domain-containing protein [Candidatus Omnitrophota bacterium]
MAVKKHLLLIPAERIENKIYLIRGHKVMIDADLAELYKVETARLTRQVRRNFDRFPPDFMFKLTAKEFENLRCQFGISSWGGRRYLPYVFTEQGVAMLSSVLNSRRAIQANIAIMRTFTKLRQMMGSHKDLKNKIEEMEKKYDGQFQLVFDALKELLAPPPAPKKGQIGFCPSEQ